MPLIQAGWQRIARLEVNVNKLVSCHMYIHLLYGTSCKLLTISGNVVNYHKWLHRLTSIGDIPSLSSLLNNSPHEYANTQLFQHLA